MKNIYRSLPVLLFLLSVFCFVIGWYLLRIQQTSSPKDIPDETDTPADETSLNTLTFQPSPTATSSLEALLIPTKTPVTTKPSTTPKPVSTFPKTLTPDEILHQGETEFSLNVIAYKAARPYMKSLPLENEKYFIYYNPITDGVIVGLKVQKPLEQARRENETEVLRKLESIGFDTQNGAITWEVIRPL
jgi:hypothetical protein